MLLLIDISRLNFLFSIFFLSKLHCYCIKIETITNDLNIKVTNINKY